MQDLKALSDAILTGDAKTARDITEKALAAGVDPLVLVNEHMIPAMAEVGRRYECNEYFVPELLISARAMKSSLELIRPLLVASGREPAGRVAIGTVKGDLHDIGKKLVAMMLEGSGFEIIDLGIDVPPEKFVEAARQGAKVVALSALLTTTMPNMKHVIDAIQQAGLRDQTRIIIGGAPVNQAYADQIGADGYAPDASSAVRKVRELISA
jgi:5-methyltetrahydrofolate--homocysteine methyltransferase